MNKKELQGWAIYWVGIAFILTCLSLAMTGKADADPCQWEIDQAKSVCRAMGRKSADCANAIENISLCRAEQSGSDPLEGLL